MPNISLAEASMLDDWKELTKYKIIVSEDCVISTEPLGRFNSDDSKWWGMKTYISVKPGEQRGPSGAAMVGHDDPMEVQGPAETQMEEGHALGLGRLWARMSPWRWRTRGRSYLLSWVAHWDRFWAWRRQRVARGHEVRV